MPRESVVLRHSDRGLELDIEFKAAPVVERFLHDPTFVTGFFGPLGCGKTAGGTWKSWLYGDAWPGARILVTRSTWPALRDTTQKEYFEWFGAAGHYEVTNKTLWVQHPSGKPTEIIFRSLDDQRDITNVLSLPIAAAHLDEPQGGMILSSEGKLDVGPGIDHELFLAILGRLGRQKGYRGMCWLTGNPPAPSHWIAKEFEYDPGPSGCGPPQNRKEDYRLYLGDQDTNRHHLPPGYYERLERLYGRDTPMARRYIRGLWIEFGIEKPFKREDIQTWGAEAGTRRRGRASFAERRGGTSGPVPYSASSQRSCSSS